MDTPYVLAVSCAEPDLEFAEIGALARAIHQRRNAMPGEPRVKLVPAALGRSDALVGGACLAVRALDGSPRGRLIGFAFLPAPDLAAAGRRLLAALRALAPAEALA